MKIEVGDYIRTNHGVIAKIIDITYDEIDNSLKWYWYWHDNMKECINKPYIAKYSKNIVDLLEKGDIIEYISARINENIQCGGIGVVVKNVDARSGRKSLKVNKHDIHDVEIKRVLTHEQYEQNCFRI